MGHDSRCDDDFSIGLEPVEWALVSYYGNKRGRRVDEVVKWMINLYTTSDRRFDPNDFMDYVRNEVLPNMENRSVRDLLLRQTVRYARSRFLADETTASTARPPTRRKR